MNAFVLVVVVEDEVTVDKVRGCLSPAWEACSECLVPLLEKLKQVREP